MKTASRKIAQLKVAPSQRASLAQQLEAIDNALKKQEPPDLREATDYDYSITKNRMARYAFNEDYNFEVHVQVSDVGQTTIDGAIYKVEDVTVELEVSDINTRDLDTLAAYAQLMQQAIELARGLQQYNGLVYTCVKTVQEFEQEAAKVRLVEFLHTHATKLAVDEEVSFDAPQLGLSNGVHKTRVSRKSFDVTVSVGKFTVRRTS